MMTVSHTEVIDFWFSELKAEDWWRKDQALDQRIAARFGSTHSAARQGELEHWRSEPLGRLAEIIVLDQFSRNIYRDRPEAFASDPIALVLAQEAVRAGADRELSAVMRSFLYLPFMHSESASMHQRAMELFAAPGLENNLRFEELHKRIIDRFGRYPHRNQILNRKSSPEEEAFLQEPNSSF